MLEDDRSFQILRALFAVDSQLRSEGNEPEFLLVRLPGGTSGLKPAIKNENEVGVTQADLHDLIERHYLRQLPCSSPDVLLKFMLTPSGRARRT
jgi:hypothetical protein